VTSYPFGRRGGVAITRIWCAWSVAVMLAVAVVLSGCGVQRTVVRPSAKSMRSAAATRVAHTSGSRTGSFVSVWPACNCTNRAPVLEQFSLQNGRPIRALAHLPGGLGVELAAPHARPDGRIWLTVSTGPKYRGDTMGGDPAPNSCTGKVVQIDPRNGTGTSMMTFPASTLVDDVIPSPNGKRAVMVGGGCATSFFNEHLTVQNLHTGRKWTLGADATPCHALFSAAWSPNGRQLVFPYGPSALSPHTNFVPHGSCRAPRFSRLAIVAADHTTPLRAWKLLPADPHCSYLDATFDRAGIAAVEGCTTGEPADEGRSPQLGDAYLVQLNHHHHQTLRLALARGFDGGGMSTDPRTGTVLISESQAANDGGRAYNWVWAFDGRTLRTVYRDGHAGATTIIAEPWEGVGHLSR
jgi:hypothetical protein